MHLSPDVQGVVNPAHFLAEPSAFRSIGVTGGIGSGKSFVCKIFQSLGIPVYDADSRAKWLIAHHPVLIREIKALLGHQAYDASGRYNTSYVSSKVFHDGELLKQLNELVHPIVQTDSVQWFEDLRQSARFRYAIKEAAIMNKAGEGNTLDKVIVVTAEESTRIERVLQRDQRRSLAEVKSIMARQMLEKDRLLLGDFVLQNNQSSSLLPQILTIHQQILKGE